MADIQRVLIPTDFTVDSLRIVLAYLENCKRQRMELILVCGFRLGDSITALLGIPKEEHLMRLQKDDFLKGCEIIRSRFKDNVEEIYADLLISGNKRYLQNYLKGAGITHIVLPDRFHFHFEERNSFDILSVLAMLEMNTKLVKVALSMTIHDVDRVDEMNNIFFRQGWKVNYE